jgi:hypothetical protein
MVVWLWAMSAQITHAARRALHDCSARPRRGGVPVGPAHPRAVVPWMTATHFGWLFSVTAAACSPPQAQTRVEQPASSPQAPAASPIAPIAAAAPTPSPQATPPVPASYATPATPTASSATDTTLDAASPEDASHHPDAVAPRAPKSRAECLEDCRRRARVADCADEQGGLVPCPCDCP